MQTGYNNEKDITMSARAYESETVCSETDKSRCIKKQASFCSETDKSRGA